MRSHDADVARFIQRQKKKDFRGVVSLPDKTRETKPTRALYRDRWCVFDKGTYSSLVRYLDKTEVDYKAKPTGKVYRPPLVRKVSLRGEVHYQ